MRLTHSHLVPLSLALATACGASQPKPVLAPEGPEATAAAAEAPAYEAPKLDTSSPIALDEWRKIKKQGTEAVRIKEVGERIAKCKEFVEQHRDHQTVDKVLDALIEALVEQGGFDPAELAKLVERKAELDEDSFSAPLDLADKYHVKHDLPLESGLALVALARERIAEKWKEVQLKPDESDREWEERYLQYYQAYSHVVAARLYLEHQQPKQVLESLDEAREHRAKIDKGIRAVNERGETVLALPGGVLEQADVIEAAAHVRLGDKDKARAVLSRSFGFFSDLELRKLYDETRAALGIKVAGETIVAAPMPAQAFVLKDLAGKKVKLTDYRGKVVLVAFFAHWCGPCKRELPELQKFAEQYKKEGVELLAISIDSFEDWPKIKPFLEENNLDLRVLLREPEQLSSYNYRGVPALYVIDRKGNVAHARTGYDADLKDKLTGEIRKLVEGGDTPGRDLVTIEVAPPGFGLRWKKQVSGDFSAVAVAPPVGGAPGEVGAVGRKGLTRWSDAGKELGSRPITGWTRELRVEDLDGNGAHEWLVVGWRGFKVLDREGEVYWEHEGSGQVQVGGVRDLDGDGFKEIVMRDDDRVMVIKANSDKRWKSPPFTKIEAVRLAPGGVVVQADGALSVLDFDGKRLSSGAKVPEGTTLTDRIRSPAGERLDFLKGRWDAKPHLDYDVDGDGKKDVVLVDGYGIAAFDREGKLLLRLRSHDVRLTPALGDLDGKPGDEIALFVNHFGLVVLGRNGAK